MKFERTDMYNSYTVTNNQYVRELPGKLNPLIDKITSSNLKPINWGELKSYRYMDEDFIDVVLLIQALAKESTDIQNNCDDFVNFLKNLMIYKYHKNPAKANSGLSGLGLLLPSNKEHLQKYRYLPVFSDLKLVAPFNTILFKN